MEKVPLVAVEIKYWRGDLVRIENWSDLDVDSDGAAGQTGPGYLQTQLPDAAKLHLQRELQHGEAVGPELEIDEKNVAMEGPAADIVQVQVLHYLTQVGVEDVSEEGVEHGAVLSLSLLVLSYHMTGT